MTKLLMHQHSSSSLTAATALTDAIRFPMFSVDAELKFTCINAEAERAFGAATEALVGRSPAEAGLTDLQAALETALSQTINRDSSSHGSVTITNKQNPVQYTLRCFAMPGGGLAGLLWPVEDEVATGRASMLKLLDDLTRDAPVGFALLDRELRFKLVNRGLAEMNGIPPEDHVNRSVAEIVPALAEKAQAIHASIIATGRSYVDQDFSVPDPASPGDLRHYSESWYPVWDLNRELLGVGVVVVDTTERRRAEADRARLEAKLEVERRRLNAVLDQMPVGVSIASVPSGELLYANEQVSKIWRHDFIPASGIQDYRAYKGFHGDGRPYEPDDWPLAHTVKTGESVGPKEIWFERGDGTRGCMEVQSAPILDQDARLSAAVVTFRDISERKLAEERLHSAVNRFRRLVDSNIVGIAVATENGVSDANDVFLGMLGVEREDLLAGRADWLRATPPEYRHLDFTALEQLKASGVCTPFQKEYERPDGSRIPILIGAAALSFTPALEWISFVVDLTEQKRLEQALTASNEDLQRFAYAASHDLQEPLRTVASFTELFARKYGPRNPEAAEYIKHIQAGVRRMSHLISDLLEYARVAHSAPPATLVKVEAALGEALWNLHAAIDESHATVMSGPLPEIAFEPRLLSQLLQNLIGNAIKYRSDRPPEVKVSAERGEGEWVFGVRDNGIGIDMRYADRIFGIFQRLHGQSKYSGTGIGLAVCKRIVDNAGGRIWVESELGVGSIFYFAIPDRPAENGALNAK